MNTFIYLGQNLSHLLEKIKAKLDTINNSSVKDISASGTTVTYTMGDGTSASFNTQDTTYSNATTSSPGLLSADDKTKLNGIAEGATANKGTVTSVATGAGLTGGSITGSGTIKANLLSETKLTNASTAAAEVSNRVYPVSLDANGKLAINVPWENTTYTSLKNPNSVTLKVYSGTSTPSNTEYDGSSAASIEVAGKSAVTNITRSGTTFTMTKADGSTATFTQQDNNTWTALKGATSTSAGTAGYAPAPPSSGYNTKYLRADGTWSIPPDTDTTYSNATASTSGLMSASDKSKLDGIETGANNYSHPTTSGNKHIPSGGSSGQILRWSSNGTAAWGDDNDTTYSNATTSTAGLMSAEDKTKLDEIGELTDSEIDALCTEILGYP